MIEKIVEQVRKGIGENSEARDAIREAIGAAKELNADSDALRETFSKARDILADKGQTTKLLASLGNASVSANSATEIISQAIDGSALPSAESLRASLENRDALLSSAFDGAERINEAAAQARADIQQALVSVLVLRMLMDNYDAGPVLDWTNTIHSLSGRFIMDLTDPTNSDW